MQYNHLPQSAYKSSDALTCLPTLQNSHEFNNAILEAADNAGCQFLFEVPAGLFGHEESRAAAIKLNAYNEHDQLAFILCDTQTGVIHIVSDNEALSAVLRFVKSYANVLNLLQDNLVTSH